MVNTRLGSERLVASRALAGQRIGLVCNPASIDCRFQHVIDLIDRDSGGTLTAIFGPQHGFRSDVQDNMIESPHRTDPRRRVPIYSLYSETREPTPAMLSEVDTLVIDLQDVGTRVYTYVYTMANCLRACQRAGVPVIVCDRPNPIGGVEMEGPVLDPRYASFVGQFPIPLRHGMTIGELARLFNEAFGIGAPLEVIAMDGWRRSMFFEDTGLPWVITSPNIPTVDTTIVYPGAVLFEGTILSEGRGTTRPFELVGAPWIEAETLAGQMNGLGLAGVVFRPAVFEPTFHKHARQACGGCQVHVTNRRAFRPVHATVALLDAFHRADPSRFGWRDPPYEYEHEKIPIDVLYGSDTLRSALASGTSADDIVASWRPALDDFARRRASFLLYD